MLLHKSEESEARTLTVVGASILLVCLVVAAFVYEFNPFGGRPEGAISVVFETPYIGQGVATGTTLVMHGVTVGKVTGVSSVPGGGVLLDADLLARPTAGLTDTMDIDFRTVNYFGITGINLSRGKGGQPLRNGMRISKAPRGNFALQALLTRLGQITTGVVTPQLISVINKATRYIDSLDPLVETMVIASSAVAKVQTVSTKQLLTNTAGVSVAFPGFINSLVDAGDHTTQIGDANFNRKGFENYSEEDFTQKANPTVIESETGLFGTVGRLEASHTDDLLPVVNIVKALLDVVPPLIRPEAIGDMVAQLRTRFEKLYGGTPEQRALRVRILLDALPGVAAPITAVGGA